MFILNVNINFIRNLPRSQPRDDQAGCFVSPGSDAFPIEPGAFETVRANPRNLSAERRDQPSPKSDNTYRNAAALWTFCLPTKTSSHVSGWLRTVPGTTRSWCEIGSVNDVGRVLLGLVRDAGSGAK